MALGELQNLLKQTMGLDAASIGESAIERAVERRLAACDVEDRDAYLAYVRSSETEFQELIEAVIVPETWFFRDREAFAALARMAFEEWLRTRAEHMQHMQDTQDMMRLLSLPCSTGEEPYSMAMALLNCRTAAFDAR